MKPARQTNRKVPDQTIENVKRIRHINPDHPVAYQVVQKARLLASGAGVASAFKRIAPAYFRPATGAVRRSLTADGPLGGG
jgi:hypothetical protein